MVYESVYSQPHCLIQGSLSDPEPELEDVGTRLPGGPPQDHIRSIPSTPGRKGPSLSSAMTSGLEQGLEQGRVGVEVGEGYPCLH